MILKLSEKQALIHKRAVATKKNLDRLEFEMIEILQEVEREKVFRNLGCTSLFQYATECLGFSESLAYSFINVARKASQFVELKTAIKSLTLSVSKAHRIAGSMTLARSKHLVEFAKDHDPVQMARRVKIGGSAKAVSKVVAKPSTKKPCPETVHKRASLTSSQKHAVFKRDGGRCTFVGAMGKRCANERWLHIHHLKEVSKGGGHDPSNLATLCSYHHDLVHQMSLPLEGQISWVRSGFVPYGVARRAARTR